MRSFTRSATPASGVRVWFSGTGVGFGGGVVAGRFAAAGVVSANGSENSRDPAGAVVPALAGRSDDAER